MGLGALSPRVKSEADHSFPSSAGATDPPPLSLSLHGVVLNQTQGQNFLLPLNYARS
jgi:hypothetical protein